MKKAISLSPPASQSQLPAGEIHGPSAPEEAVLPEAVDSPDTARTIQPSSGDPRHATLHKPRKTSSAKD